MKHITSALARAFNVAPPNDEAHGTPHAAGPKDQQTQTHSASNDAGRKTLATLTAQLAIRGYALHQLADGSLMVSRWNLSRPLAGLSADQAFLTQVGGSHA